MPLIEELGYMPTEKYARAKELLKHSEMIGRKWGLYDKTLFQTEVSNLRWNEDEGMWSVETSRGDDIKARFIIPAAGPLHRPKLPGVKGIEDFKGHSFHSSRWDYDYTDGDVKSEGINSGALTGLADKRVGIIGTGATAVQIVPNVANYAKDLFVFQRTPSSIDVRGNKPTDPAWADSLQKGWQNERMENFNIIVNGGILPNDLVQDGWTDILHKLLARGSAGMEQDPAKAAAERQMADFEKMNQVRARCDEVVKDKATADSLKPWYNQLCKRPCFHDEYLQAFNKPNVHLIDTKGMGISHITEKGIVAIGKEFELDCIIYATGFELATDFSHRSNMEVYGRGGQTITDYWKNGVSTLHGWTTRGFPNFFLVTIVQAALTPNFIHVTTEQATHLAYVISQAKKRNIRTVEPTQEAEDKWVQTIVSLAKLRADFLKECTPGYYNNEGTPSKSGARNGAYGGGSPAFIKILQDWRAKDDLEGLDLQYFES
jgi:cyclohexanone monooxygenase